MTLAYRFPEFAKHFSNPAEKPLLKLPEEFKLPENKTVGQQENIIHRKNQYPVQHTRPQRLLPIREPVLKQRLLDKQYGESGTRKHDQDYNYLPGILNIPTILKLIIPGCHGQLFEA
jgi:hypothetical protein